MGGKESKHHHKMDSPAAENSTSQESGEVKSKKGEMF